MARPSKRALREIVGEAGRGGRVPKRGINNKGQDKRAAELPQGSEDLKK